MYSKLAGSTLNKACSAENLAPSSISRGHFLFIPACNAHLKAILHVWHNSVSGIRMFTTQ